MKVGMMMKWESDKQMEVVLLFDGAGEDIWALYSQCATSPIPCFYGLD